MSRAEAAAGNAARERRWETASGRVQFTAPKALSALGAPRDGEPTLITLRSNDQFNTTVYGVRDCPRGLEGSRDVLLISPEEMAWRHLAEGQLVAVESAVADGPERVVRGLRMTPYDLPLACVAAYDLKANPLVPRRYYDKMSKTPAYKGVPVRIRVPAANGA